MTVFEVYLNNHKVCRAGLLRRFVALIDRLPRSAKQHWNRARAREFSIGIQGGAKPHSIELRLEPATLRAVAGVRARIGLAVFGAATT